MYDLKHLSVNEVLQMSAGLEGLGEGCASMEEAAGRIVRYFYDSLRDGPSGPPACALVRLYRTLRFGDLEILLRGFARSMARDHTLSADTTCLTLLATAGEEPAWNVRQRSVDHQAIPLLSEEMVLQLPMVAQLIQQLGYKVRDILAPSPDLLLDPARRTHNVFWVPEAQGSPFIPAQQEFVLRYGIRSVVGCGSLLSGGSLFALILFSRVPIPEQQAGRFKSLAVSVRAALTPHARGPIFASAPRPTQDP